MSGLIRLACASCGAPLEIPRAVPAVTCSHCGTSLLIRNTGGAVWSEVQAVLASIKADTKAAVDASVRVSQELELKRLTEERPRAQEEWLLAKHSLEDVNGPNRLGLAVVIVPLGFCLLNMVLTPQRSEKDTATMWALVAILVVMCVIAFALHAGRRAPLMRAHDREQAARDRLEKIVDRIEQLTKFLS